MIKTINFVRYLFLFFLFTSSLPYLSSPRAFFLDEEVKEKYLVNPSIEEESSRQIDRNFQEKQFPLGPLLAICSAFFLALYLTNLPVQKKEIPFEEKIRNDFLNLEKLLEKGNQDEFLSYLFKFIKENFSMPEPHSSEEALKVLASQKEDYPFWRDTLRDLDKMRFAKKGDRCMFTLETFFSQTIKKLEKK